MSAALCTSAGLLGELSHICISRGAKLHNNRAAVEEEEALSVLQRDIPEPQLELELLPQGGS